MKEKNISLKRFFLINFTWGIEKAVLSTKQLQRYPFRNTLLQHGGMPCPRSSDTFCSEDMMEK